jgi:glycosyltransferase involved in cell wall biosynthesis
MPLNSYIIITPAHNEAKFIDLTFHSVTTQSVTPKKWIIVSDGSTDATDEIVRSYAERYAWIELVRIQEKRERNFAGKVHAFMAGFEHVRNTDYDVICSLDADISFQQDYFEFLLGKLSADRSLGLVGTPFEEAGSGETYDYRFVNIEHVSGACQVFRRECFDDIGGYVPIRGGGIDHTAVVTARMKGWKTRTFTDMVCLHHRKIGTAQHGSVAAQFKSGIKDYMFGNHPIWEAFRLAYQMTRKPWVVRGLTMSAGFLWAAIRRTERPVPRELVVFYRREQMRRLSRLLTGQRQPATQPGISEKPAETSAR